MTLLAAMPPMQIMGSAHCGQDASVVICGPSAFTNVAPLGASRLYLNVGQMHAAFGGNVGDVFLEVFPGRTMIPPAKPFVPAVKVTAMEQERLLYRALAESLEDAGLDDIAIQPAIWDSASAWLRQLATSSAVPLPLILPTSDGGLSTEWHEAGLNVEVRFRRSDYVFCLVEDAACPSHDFSGNDPTLTVATVALVALARRLHDAA